MENQKILWTFREAAGLLNVKPATLRKWRRNGTIAVVRVANSRRGLRIPLCELERLQRVEVGTSSALSRPVAS
jgi:excisionase family DNA binding protein